MIKMQVAFQGGGAKLVNLLAVAEVLEQAHNDGTIRITRVAGTSAGSIVACILASGVGVSNARKSLDCEEMRNVADILSSKVTWFDMLGSAISGKPLKSIDPLTDWLARLLIGKNAHSSDKRISEVCSMRAQNPMKLLIVSSDLTNRGSHVASESDLALSAVEASCGIPLAFRTWKGAGYERVDGGLCANLPVDFLRDKEQDYGEVLAVSFQKPIVKKHDSIGKYLMALIDTAISAGEDRAKESLPKPNVFSISTNLTTLDFSNAVREGIGEQYSRIKAEAKEWLRDFIEIKKQERLTLIHDPWSDQSPSSKDFMARMGEYFEALEHGRMINYHRARLTVYAPSLQSSANTVTGPNDMLRLELTFSPGAVPVHMMSLSVTEIDEQTNLDASTLKCIIKDPLGAPIAATLIPMSLPASPMDRNVAVCFSKPLPPNSGPYTLDYVLKGTKLLRTLQVSGSDCVTYYPSGAAGSVGVVELILMVPSVQQLGRTFSGEGQDARWLRSDELPHAHLEPLEAIGCVAHNVPKAADDTLWSLNLTLDIGLSRP